MSKALYYNLENSKNLENESDNFESLENSPAKGKDSDTYLR